MPDESEARRDESSGLRLNEYIRPITLPPLLKSISQDSFEVQLRNTAWSDANSACRLVLSSDSQECMCKIHRVLLQVIVPIFFIGYPFFLIYVQYFFITDALILAINFSVK